MNTEREFPTLNEYLYKANRLPQPPTVQEDLNSTLDTIIPQVDETATSDSYRIEEKIMVTAYCIFVEDPELAAEFLGSLGFNNPSVTLSQFQDTIFGIENGKVINTEPNFLEKEVTRISFSHDDAEAIHEDMFDENPEDTEGSAGPAFEIELDSIDQRIIQQRAQGVPDQQIRENINLRDHAYKTRITLLLRAGLIEDRVHFSPRTAQKTELEDKIIALLTEKQEKGEEVGTRILAEELGIKQNRVQVALKRRGIRLADPRSKKQPEQIIFENSDTPNS